MNLKELLAKALSELTAEEKAFIKANAAQLSAEEKEKFAEILGDEVDEEGLKALVAASVAEAARAAADKISDEIVGKFLTGVTAARAKVLAGEQKVNKENDDVTRTFLKALMSGDLVRAKALSTTTPAGASPDDANAGVLIPKELMTEVLRIAQIYGIARRDMLYLPFGAGPGNTRQIPALGSSVSVFWTGEKGAKRSTQPSFNLVNQTLKKLAAIVPMTEEILEDSAVPITPLLGALLGEAVAKEEDVQFFAGTGSPWTGVLNNGSVNHVDASGDSTHFSADDLLDMQDETPAGAQDGAKYYLNRKTFTIVRKMKDQNDRYIYQEPAGQQPATIWGKPFELSEAFPAPADVDEGDPFVLYGNLKRCAVFGDKQQIRLKVLDQATITDTDDDTTLNLAEQDCVALRAVERVGYVLALPAGCTVLKAGPTSS